ncbi:MAG: 30S ribosomal protein S6, partial [Phycisphaerae bacterium]
MNTYEAMFLLDAALASNWEAAEGEVRRLLDRASAKVLGLRRWDERRLAFEIKRRKRGIYALAFFEAPGEKINDLERDARLSEMILRLLVLRREGWSAEQIEKALHSTPTERAYDGPREGFGRPSSPR